MVLLLFSEFYGPQLIPGISSLGSTATALTNQEKKSSNEVEIIQDNFSF
ncbi:unnamed protein product, partial [Rotaria sp. Silwood1]